MGLILETIVYSDVPLTRIIKRMDTELQNIMMKRIIRRIIQRGMGSNCLLNGANGFPNDGIVYLAFIRFFQKTN